MSLNKKLRLFSAAVIGLMIIIGIISIRSAILVRQDFIHITDVTAPEVIGLGEIKVAGGRVLEEALSYTLLNVTDGGAPPDPKIEVRARKSFDDAAAGLDHVIVAHR